MREGRELFLFTLWCGFLVSTLHLGFTCFKGGDAGVAAAKWNSLEGWRKRYLCLESLSFPQTSRCNNANLLVG